MFRTKEKEVIYYEKNTDRKTKHADMVKFLMDDFEEIYDWNGPDEKEGPVHGTGMSKTFRELSCILMDTAWPARYEDDYLPPPRTRVPRSTQEREQKYMAHYRAIFPAGHLEPPPTGLWAACSKRIDNKTLIKKPPPCIVEKYICKDPLGLNEMPVNFPPPVIDDRLQAPKPMKNESTILKTVKQLDLKAAPPKVSMASNRLTTQPKVSKPVDHGSAPAKVARVAKLQTAGISRPRPKPVVPSQTVGLSQDPAMEDLREAKCEKEPSLVQKRLNLAANRLEYFSRRQQTGSEIWMLKEGKDINIPEINFTKVWDARKKAFVTIKNGNVISERSKNKKRGRDEEESKSRKKQCTEVHFQPKFVVPSSSMPFVGHLKPQPGVSGYKVVPSRQQKRPREESESLSRKKQCTTLTSFVPVPPLRVVKQVPSAQPIRLQPVVAGHYHPGLVSVLSHPRQHLPVQDRVTTRMVQVHPSGQVSDLTRFGLNFHLSIRPVD